MTDATWLERPFFDLFCDAIQLARSCSDKGSNDDLRKLLARAALMNAIFSIEAAANCALRCYPSSRALHESLDKLGILDKFEFLLATRNRNESFDRGRREIQQIQELISVRNKYVHPKSRQRPMQFEAGTAQPAAFTFKTDGGATKLLNIPHQRTSWDFQHAQSAIIAVAQFLSLFFVRLCAFSPKDATRYLCNEVLVDDRHIVVFGMDHADQIRFIQLNWNADIAFVDLPDATCP